MATPIRLIFTQSQIEILINNVLVYSVAGSFGPKSYLAFRDYGLCFGPVVNYISNLNIAPLNPENGQFTGKQYDPGTGLIYFGSRWYDPEVGRFTNQDPAKSGPNWYAYCSNNPLRYVDPTGNDDEDFGDIGEVDVEIGEMEAEIASIAESFQESFSAGEFGGEGFSGYSAPAEDCGSESYQLPLPYESYSQIPTEIAADESAETAYEASLLAYGNNTSTNAPLVLYQKYPCDSWNQDGFLGSYSTTVTAQEDFVFSRIGDIDGSYVSPPGTTLSERGLPSTYTNTDETLWRVIKPFDMQAGISAPWQDASGLGIQYLLPFSIKYLLNNGYIEQY